MKFCFTAILSLLLLSAQAAFDFNENCRKAYTHIIHFEFDKGKAILQKEKAAHPNNNAVDYVENYIDFLVLAIGQEEAEFEKREDHKSERLDRIENGDKNSPYYLYSQAEIHVQWAFSRILFGEYFTGLREINKAYSLLQENDRKFPNFILNKKALGLFHALIGTVPDNYKWAVRLFGIDGTISQGVGELNQVLNVATSNEEYAYLKSEVIFLLTFIELNFSKDEENIQRVLNIIQRMEKKSPIVVFSEASILIKSNRNDQAIQVLQEHSQKETGFRFHYLDFLTGETKLHRLDEDAHLYYVDYLRNFKGKSYVKAAYQKLAWHYLLQGNRKAYYENIEKAEEFGSDLLDEDKQALKEAKSGQIPNVPLLKARLLFDGGYYEKALKVLQDKSNQSQLKDEKEKVEFTYRLARIYDAQNENVKAIKHYKKTIEEGEDLPHYFAANSALHLGLIYEQQGNNDAARKYFEMCPEFKDHEYRNSINQKAKAGLARLRN